MTELQTAIILGDSFNNTLGLIRSLGQAGARIILVLVGNDRLHISRSRYVKDVYRIESWTANEQLLKHLSERYPNAYLICSNDKAAKWVDDREKWLSKHFITPMRGEKLGHLFDKPQQCELAKACGLQIPESTIYNRREEFPAGLRFPLLLKPSNSNSGEKSDIHICRTSQDVAEALSTESSCDNFIVQEYIEKDFEINMIGVSTDQGVVIPGGIKKIRHYPTIYSPCSFGRFLSATDLKVETEPIAGMIRHTGYHGPFSVEFIRKGDTTYFLEINFRHDGLAYAATAAGANLLEMYINGKPLNYRLNPTYMMDLSIDFCHVKDGNLSKWQWLMDFMHTKCQLNFNWRDPMPTIHYYKSKITK